MWQTQSVGPVRTAHISVLLTVNIVSHLQTITITRTLSSGGEGVSILDVSQSDMSTFKKTQIRSRLLIIDHHKLSIHAIQYKCTEYTTNLYYFRWKMRLGMSETVEHFKKVNRFDVKHTDDPRKQYIQRITFMRNRTLNSRVNWSTKISTTFSKHEITNRLESVWQILDTLTYTPINDHIPSKPGTDGYPINCNSTQLYCDIFVSPIHTTFMGAQLRYPDQGGRSPASFLP